MRIENLVQTIGLLRRLYRFPQDVFLYRKTRDTYQLIFLQFKENQRPRNLLMFLKIGVIINIFCFTNVNRYLRNSNQGQDKAPPISLSRNPSISVNVIRCKVLIIATHRRVSRKRVTDLNFN